VKKSSQEGPELCYPFLAMGHKAGLIEPYSEAVPLRRNRDFNLLWLGQVVSDVGARVSGVAFPLLVLAITGSPAKAGIVASAGSFPLLVLTLPAGALVDRWNRKRVMVVADAARCLALASVVASLALDALTFAQIVVVALVEGVGFVFFNVAERSALPKVVPADQLSAALARNQVREYGALLAGPPLGGLLFGLGRLAPFLFDAVSYAASVFTILLIRTDFRRERSDGQRPHLIRDLRTGLAWFWRQPFIRTTSLLVTGSDFTLNALYLVVIVLARDRGAPPELIGAMFVFLGVGGLLGSFAAPSLARRLGIRTIVVATMSVTAALLPFLIVVPGAITPGLIYGAMFVLHPAWNASVVAIRLHLTPDDLQGRVSSIATLFSLGSVTIGSLVVGFMLEAAGTTPTVLILFAVMLVVAAAAFASRAVKDAAHPAAATDTVRG
jgi:predicted MFS family arabinose efflux permease